MNALYSNDTELSSTAPISTDSVTTVRKVDHLTRDFQVIGLNSNTAQSPMKPVGNNNSGEQDAHMTEEPLEKAAAVQSVAANENKGMEEASTKPSSELSMVELSTEPPSVPHVELKATALEELAKNLETIGDKYRSLDNSVKDFDMIAFKVLVPPIEKSSYVIGMVEDINRISDSDFYLTLLIMGKN